MLRTFSILAGIRHPGHPWTSIRTTSCCAPKAAGPPAPEKAAARRGPKASPAGERRLGGGGFCGSFLCAVRPLLKMEPTSTGTLYPMLCVSEYYGEAVQKQR